MSDQPTRPVGSQQVQVVQVAVSLADELSAAMASSASPREMKDSQRTSPREKMEDCSRTRPNRFIGEGEKERLDGGMSVNGKISRQKRLSSATSRLCVNASPCEERERSNLRSQETEGIVSDAVVSDTSPLLGNGACDSSEKDQDYPTRPDPGASQKRSLFFISLVSVLLAVADKVSEPVMEQYIYQVYTVQVYGNSSVHVEIANKPCVHAYNTSVSHDDMLRNEIQDRSADLMMRLEMLAFSLGMVSCLLLGTYSDVLGRRLVLLLPLVGHFLRDATAPVVIHWDLGLPALYGGYAVFGLGGATAGTLLGCYVYSADVTTTEKSRTLGLALVMAAMGAGAAVSTYLAGVFISKTGSFCPSLTASLCDALCIAIVILFLPETAPRCRQRNSFFLRFFYPSLTASLIDALCIAIVILFLPETVPRCRQKLMTPWHSVRRIVHTFSSRDNPQQRPLLLLLLLTFFIGVFGDYPSLKLDVLYLMDEPFCWSSSRIGLLGSVKYGVTRLTSILILLPLQRVLSQPTIAAVGAASFVVSNVLTGLAKTDLLIYLAAGAAMAVSIMFAAVRSMMSRLVPPDRQGALFGGIAVLESACFGISQVTFFSLYKAVLSFMPGITYFALATLYLLNIVLFSIYSCLWTKSKRAAVQPGSVQTQVEGVPEKTASKGILTA